MTTRLSALRQYLNSMLFRKIHYHLITVAVLTALLFSFTQLKAEKAPAEDGYSMWLRYNLIEDEVLLKEYRETFENIVLTRNSETLQAVENELTKGFTGLLGLSPEVKSDIDSNGTLVLGTPANSEIIASLKIQNKLDRLGEEGFLIEQKNIQGYHTIVVAANTDLGVLYGAFHLLRMIQTHQPLANLSVVSRPHMPLRLANHWDNVDRSVERGYAGLSLWEWSTLPEYKHPRYADYARMTASLGINGVAINNVNAVAWFITDHFLKKIAVLADIFRPYGIKVYLSINYSSPVSLGGLDGADPLDSMVINWWKERVQHIYASIPNFGGFLVKADSEGQPGPKTYGRNHAQGANMLAEALEPFGGIVIWRAFVYGERQADRVREAYDEFVPLDGKFKDNVVLQIKNGPLDFMPREPFSPLFGALPKTNTLIEFQVTQEYLGNGNHLVYKGPMFKEILDADTYAKGNGSTVGKVLSGEVFDYKLSGMAAVVNPGTDRNWTGHPFVQSSWYAFGRLAWDYSLPAGELAEEWIRMTFSNDEMVISTIKKIMMTSGEAAVNFREPLGLTHIGTGSHYGPAPWSNRSNRFHQADKYGIGFDRTINGSNAVEQYYPPLNDIFNDIDRIPEKYLLWFHHVSWNHQMKSGHTLWEELVYKYYEGVEQVRQMQAEWDSLEGMIDRQRFQHVKALLEIQECDAVRWRNSCVLYFQTLSELPIPEGLEQPKHDLDYYKELERKVYVP
ncbi:alpha-glucuronidase family glycosyl hydrolase [Gaoshiqia sediminis]|uniref:Xylan alpha-1,2-glucuronidase n=1 Tax=Gaoshiqia sediminis TaxID=2986998 RepID=A0AA42C8A9_9BACT|nr:alpha-glucuronidase family glycosyl hydrolase [Gaoshiqia sediminis]MCW0484504.1 alpha-glucuronidase [Gaoshiqia sediminis]